MLARLVLVVGGLGVGLLLAEVGVRLANPQGYEFFFAFWPAMFDVSIFQADPDTIWTLRPGSTATMQTPEYRTVVRVNALGIRGPEVAAKAPGTLRVLAVGDSFTLAHQVDEDETFEGRLGPLLSEALGQRVEVLDAGVDSTGTWSSLGQARRLVPLVQADVVLLTWFLGNDFADDDRFGRLRQSPPPLQPDRLPLLDDTLGRWSLLYHYARTWQRARRAAHGQDGEPMFVNELKMFAEGGLSEGMQAPSRAALSAFAEGCEALGVACVVALAPPAFVVYPDRAAVTFRLVGLDPAGLRLDAPAEAVLGLIPPTCHAVDLTPALRDAAADPLYFTFDGHWRPEGHAVVAGALAPVLTDVLVERAPPGG